MRRLLLIASAALAGCSTAPNQIAGDSHAEAKLQRHLAGKTAGKAQECLPTFRTNDMVRIDEDTVLFRDGSSRVYRNELVGSCNGLGSQNYTLVTTSLGGGGQMCRGDIARVVDISSGMAVGSCSLGQFVAYSRPGA